MISLPGLVSISCMLLDAACDVVATCWSQGWPDWREFTVIIIDIAVEPQDTLNAKEICIIVALKSGHLANQDTFSRSQKCLHLWVPL